MKKKPTLYDFFLRQFGIQLDKGDLSGALIMARQAETAAVIMEKRLAVPELICCLAQLVHVASLQMQHLLLERAGVTREFEQAASIAMHGADALVRRSTQDDEESANRLLELCQSMLARVYSGRLYFWVRYMRRRILTCMEISSTASTLTGLVVVNDRSQEQFSLACIKGANRSLGWFSRRHWSHAPMLLSIAAGLANQSGTKGSIAPRHIDIAAKAIKQRRFLKSKVILTAIEFNVSA